MMASQRIDGGCHCGRVRYRVESIFDAGYCHCSVCRRVHGAPVVAWIAAPESDFTLLAGSPRVHQWCGDRLPWFDTRDDLPRVDDGTLPHPDRRTEGAHGDLEQLRRLEESHLRAEVRSSPEAMRALLADDFVEFGSSGRVLDRAAVEASVAGQAAFGSRIDDFVARALSPHAALTTYRLSAWTASGGPVKVTLRSSVWVRREGRWVMVFHQGTAAP